MHPDAVAHIGKSVQVFQRAAVEPSLQSETALAALHRVYPFSLLTELSGAHAGKRNTVLAAFLGRAAPGGVDASTATNPSTSTARRPSRPSAVVTSDPVLDAAAAVATTPRAFAAALQRVTPHSVAVSLSGTTSNTCTGGVVSVAATHCVPILFITQVQPVN